MYGSEFWGNAAANGNGGAINIELQDACNVTVQIVQSNVSSNTATLQGGAIYFNQIAAPPPSNLELELGNSTTSKGPCYAMYNTTVYRQWAYGASLLLESCILSHNQAMANTSTAPSLVPAASGGALAIGNINATILDSDISNNSANTSAGAIAMLPGTAQLHVVATPD